MALVEAAIILPLVVLLLVGVIEVGFAWRDGNTLARATQQAGRTLGRLADSEIADYEALRALDSALAGLSASSIEKVIVYDAETTADTPPATCLSVVPQPSAAAGQDDLCNVYSGQQVAADIPGAFGCGAGAWDVNYCPTDDREREGDTPDRIGVWIELNFDQVTSVLPGSISLTHAAVFQLEPCIAGASSC